MTGSIQRSN